MQRERRLRRAADFAAVYSRGRSWANPLLVLKALPSAQGQSRVGFAVGKRLGKAVMRNRMRRRLRAMVRELAPRPGWDVVLVARGPAVAASFQQLQSAVSDLFRRARLLGPSTPRASSPVEQ